MPRWSLRPATAIVTRPSASRKEGRLAEAEVAEKAIELARASAAGKAQR